MNFKSFSRSLEQFCLTVGQNNFSNKIPYFQILACSTDTGETHVAWTTKDFDETCLGKCLPFPILADHTQALTRKFDLLDSNQGTSKHAYLILDPKGAIRHKQIGDGKVAFNVEEALTTLSSCKLPVFDQSSFEGMQYVLKPNFS